MTKPVKQIPLGMSYEAARQSQPEAPYRLPSAGASR
jgi:hypothetical protein